MAWMIGGLNGGLKEEWIKWRVDWRNNESKKEWIERRMVWRKDGLKKGSNKKRMGLRMDKRKDRLKDWNKNGMLDKKGLMEGKMKAGWFTGRKDRCLDER